ncbi:MAG: hypothetical protein F6J92_10920 [Symploca sp. SIO1A3]|nr:hypothetical protein [Symploca sp. SIO1A3]
MWPRFWRWGRGGAGGAEEAGGAGGDKGAEEAGGAGGDKGAGGAEEAGGDKGAGGDIFTHQFPIPIPRETRKTRKAREIFTLTKQQTTNNK